MNEILTQSFVLLAGVSVEVGEIRPKAMPVILTKPQEWETWLSGDWAAAGMLQRLQPDGSLIVVARGGKSD